MKDAAESTHILCSVFNLAVTYFAQYIQRLEYTHGPLFLVLGGLLGGGEML